MDAGNFVLRASGDWQATAATDEQWWSASEKLRDDVLRSDPLCIKRDSIEAQSSTVKLERLDRECLY